jgi:2-phospho-L-lactate guanylyltransferase
VGFSRGALRRGLWAVVPVRGIAQGKSRLAATLGLDGRVRFNRWLLTHTLNVVADWQGDLTRCLVLSPCAQVLNIARRMRACAVLEPCPHRDLNRALVRMLRAARRSGVHHVLVLSCDLPWLSRQGLNAMLDCAVAGAHWVLATDAAHRGTNALLVNARTRYDFGYGEDSRRRHTDLASQLGYTITVLEHPEFARDIDTPTDFRAWRRSAA